MHATQQELQDALGQYQHALELKQVSSRTSANLLQLYQLITDISTRLRADFESDESKGLSVQDLETFMAYKLAVCPLCIKPQSVRAQAHAV